MKTEEKIKKLKDFDNEASFREFLIDLLKKMKFKSVFHTHRYGGPEYGKDIIAKYEHDWEGFEWYAFVVKKGRIGGGTNEIEIIKNQIKQSFEYPYENIDGNRVSINKVKVVTNENFTAGAQESLRKSHELKVYNNFDFWWNERLIPLIDKYYPDFWLPGDLFAKEYSRSLRRKIEQEFEIRDLSIKKIDDKKLQKLLNIFIEPKATELIIKKNPGLSEQTIAHKKIKLKSIINDEDNYILSGDQGSGKTKILNTLICDAANPEYIYREKRIPVKLNATEIRDDGFNFHQIIEEKVLVLAGEFSGSFQFDEYQLTLFIDNFDLLSNQDKETFINKLSDFLDESKTTNYILTKRKSEFDDDLDARIIRIHNFNQRQVEDFAVKYFEGHDRGKRFIQILRESDLLSRLPTTPLVITLISLLYDENNFEIPATLTDIYNDFTSVLLGKLGIRNQTELLSYANQGQKRKYRHRGSKC